MLKIFTKSNLGKVLPFLVILLGSILVSRELFLKGYFPMHDDMQVNRLYEMDLCFRDGQIPCRWVPDMGYGYGYPLFNYYPPLPFYFGELVHALGFSFLDSTKVMFIAGFLISGILMFLFARKLWGNWGGLLSSVLYIFAPYHAVDVYVRGAMNEFWALVLLPGIYLALYQLTKTRKRKWGIILSIFIALTLLSHNLMSFIFVPGLFLFWLIIVYFEKSYWKEIALKTFLYGILGFSLAAFFTLPVLFEAKYVHIETMTMGYFNFLAHYVSLDKLLISRYWGYGSSSWGQTEGMPFQVGYPHWILALVVFAGFTYLKFKKKILSEIFSFSCFFIILFIFSLFLIHARSTPVWLSISYLKYLQFPWRFLGLVTFSISALGGGIVFMAKKEKFKFLIMACLSIITVALNFTYFTPSKRIIITDKEKLFSAKGWNKLQTDAIFDYLPKYAKAPPAGPAPLKPEVKEGIADISEISKGTNWYNFEVNVKKESTLQVPLYDFPVWKASVDKKETKITHDNFLGLITIKVPEGEHKVNLKLVNTPIRTLGNLISGFSWLFLLFFLIRRRFVEE